MFDREGAKARRTIQDRHGFRTAQGEPDAIDNEVDLHPAWDALVHEREHGAADKKTRKRYEAEDQQCFSAHLRFRSDSHRGRGSDSPCAGTASISLM